MKLLTLYSSYIKKMNFTELEYQNIKDSFKNLGYNEQTDDIPELDIIKDLKEKKNPKIKDEFLKILDDLKQKHRDENISEKARTTISEPINEKESKKEKSVKKDKVGSKDNYTLIKITRNANTILRTFCKDKKISTQDILSILAEMVVEDSVLYDRVKKIYFEKYF